MTILDAQDVDMTFGPPHRPHRAVASASISVPAGQVVALVGESGSGKTTLGRILAGLQAPTGGRIGLGGEPQPRTGSGALRAWRSRVGFVFQDPVGSLSPHQSARVAVAEVVRRRSGCDSASALAEASRLLGEVGLPDDAHDRRPSFLSGGQARRVGVARVLAMNPVMIVADEPTAGLDVSIQAGLLNLLRSIVDKKRVGLLLITHNLATVRWIADAVVVMYLGHVVESGPTETIFENPAHPYTRALIEAVPRFGVPPAAALAGDPPDALAGATGCVFRSRCPATTAACLEPPVMVRQGGRAVACHHAGAAPA